MRNIGIVASLLAAAPVWAAKEHKVVPKDCLWQLAKTYYGNPFRWKVIYSANSNLIKDPHWIYPDQVFVIPDAPGPEIGELGARPIETGAAVRIPVDSSPQEAPAAPAAATATGAEAATPEEARPIMDDLREKMPLGQTGQYPSMTRAKMPRDWEPDGRIIEYDEREGTAAAGDSVLGRLGKDVSTAVGDRFTIYRHDAVRELDEDKQATYLQKVGTVEVRKDLGQFKYRFLILKSGDSVQTGDLLTKDGL